MVRSTRQKRRWRFSNAVALERWRRDYLFSSLQGSLMQYDPMARHEVYTIRDKYFVGAAYFHPTTFRVPSVGSKL
jgi:hypothetical protein